MGNQLKYGLFCVCSIVGMIIGMNFDDKPEKEDVSSQIVNNRHSIDTVLVKDTVVKEIVRIKWRTRRACCCDSTCCSNKNKYE